MNYFSFFVSRILGFAAIGVLLIGVQAAGGWMHQRRDLPRYHAIGAGGERRGTL